VVECPDELVPRRVRLGERRDLLVSERVDGLVAALRDLVEDGINASPDF
jgi:hypothetical protein